MQERRDSGRGARGAAGRGRRVVRSTRSARTRGRWCRRAALPGRRRRARQPRPRERADPAAEIALLYHERWELELAFDEIKTHTLEREESLRSRAPERVLQEIWGLAIGYNLVHWYIARIAERLDLPPTRISYRHTLMLPRGFWLSVWFASPGVVPRRLEQLDAQSALFVLPPRRPRRYPRAVKVKMSGYARKR